MGAVASHAWLQMVRIAAPAAAAAVVAPASPSAEGEAPWVKRNGWKTGTFQGKADLSNQRFDFVYANAHAKLLAWVANQGTDGKTKWLNDFAIYVKARDATRAQTEATNA